SHGSGVHRWRSSCFAVDAYLETHLVLGYCTMKYRTLGRTDLSVSLIGLGTMTWGEQNTEAEAHAQLDYALGRGINLIDTAEMYPVPPRAETQGRTESYIGSWLARTGKRQDIVLATKAAGPASGNRPKHLRNGKSRH